MTETLYNQDFQIWLEKTIASLKNRDFNTLDVENLIEELTELGKSEKRTLESNLMILLAHLLKLQVQHDAPSSMQEGYSSIIEHRQRVLKNLRHTPSLKSYLETAIQSAYSDARKIAIKESKLAKLGVRIPDEHEYPVICPFSVEQILDEDFFLAINPINLPQQEK
ncbi:DUF29 domain-containing protein [Aphanothece hegewaldii CCALA 016]|uniref:DUF29 domain-containing protein n=1 Tax=Aphanothece hegewaldii CCALA 016 TaxID=2107694 RepID=A0A2T1LUZ9_9CHRO|nr:DUF29 domain-containing protein [Aphanothece hegewaldii]PSF35448.1 DUF29 domain-containing protein [Aphanothece hegewaldii CCALA 016]